MSLVLCELGELESQTTQDIKRFGQEKYGKLWNVTRDYEEVVREFWQEKFGIVNE